MKEERKIVIPSLLGEPSDKIFKLVGTKSQVWPKFYLTAPLIVLHLSSTLLRAYLLQISAAD